MSRKLIPLAVLLALLLTGCAVAEPLFEPKSDGIYNYCPSAFVEDGVIHMYYCTNTKPRDVVDSIGYRYSTDGGKTYSEESIVLEHTKGWKGGWDNVHTCDPDVIKGHFLLDGEEYFYLMAYLGCDTGNCQENEVGIAVAREPGGPFVKVTALNPIVPYERDRRDGVNDLFQWGTGQPSLVSIDKQGQVMIIYTKGTGLKTSLFCEKWDLSDLNNAHRLQYYNYEEITNTGVIGRDNRQATLNNADFVYDPVSGVMYLAAEGAPTYIEGVDVPGKPEAIISTTVRVMKFSQKCAPDKLNEFFRQNITYRWKLMYLLGMEETGYPRNHNAGILSDPYGWLPVQGEITLLYSTSEVNRPSDSLWTYRVHSTVIPITE